jgi:hypothetical protein
MNIRASTYGLATAGMVFVLSFAFGIALEVDWPHVLGTSVLAAMAVGIAAFGAAT